MSLVYISVHTDVRVSGSRTRCGDTTGTGYRGVSINGERTPEQKRRVIRGREKGKKRSRGMEEGGQVSKSLYLPRKNVESTKQMNRREEGMITTKMIIFNQNHDNNNK